MQHKNKLLIWISTIFGLASVLVGGVSTFAWFQLNSQAPETTIRTKDPNLEIDNENVTGYKVVPTMGSDGFIDKTSETVTAKKGQTFDTSNYNQATADTNFDVPAEGLGYYLVKKNESGTFKYNYNGSSYARKFKDYADSSVYNKYIHLDLSVDDFLDCKVNDAFEIKQYSYNNTEHKTVNTQITGFTSGNDSTATVDVYCNITVVARGYYKVWYNTNLHEVVFEKEFDPVEEHKADSDSDSLESFDTNIPIQPLSTSESGTPGTYIYIQDETWKEWTANGVDPVAHMYDVTFASGSGYSSISDIQTNSFGSSCTVGSGYVDAKMTWLSGSYRQYYIIVPWYISSFNVCFYTKKNGTDRYAKDKGNNNATISFFCTRGTSYSVYFFSKGYGDDAYWSGSEFRTYWSKNTTSNYTYTEQRFTITYQYYLDGTYQSQSVTDTALKNAKYTINTSKAQTWVANTNSYIGCYSNSGLTITFSSAYITNDSLVIYVKYLTAYIMTLTPSYFVSDGNGNYTRLDIDCNQGTLSEKIIRGNTFTTSQYFDNTYYKDDSQGIFYTFTREDDYWYTDIDCTSENYNGSTPTRAIPLYCKMVCQPLKTFYVDTSQTSWGSVCNICSTDTSKSISNISVSGKPIIDGKLYRFSIPTDLSYFYVKNSSSSGLNQTGNVTSGWTNNGYLLLGGDDGTIYHNRWKGFMSEKSIAGGKTARIYVKQPNGSFPDQAHAVAMNAGDGLSGGNDFIYEEGLEIPVGSEIYIKIDGESTYYKYSNYISGTIPSYVGESDKTYHNVLTKNYTGSMRFNFYITHSDTPSERKLAIAMVPQLGNGYYIMHYDSSLIDPLNTYKGAIKMDSNDYSAIYTGFYATKGSQIFIKSYLNGVDNIVDALTSTTDSNDATILSKVITIQSTGRYTIQVTNTTADIVKYTVDDFFKLNPINTDSAGSPAAVHAQQTSLIMEVPFKCNNPYVSTITMTTNAGVSYIGTNLCITNARIGDGATIYSTLRGASSPSTFYTGLLATDSGTPVTSKTIAGLSSCITSIPANSSATYYAYILIDYMPGVTLSNITSGTLEFKLFLQSIQP